MTTPPLKPQSGSETMTPRVDALFREGSWLIEGETVPARGAVLYGTHSSMVELARALEAECARNDAEKNEAYRQRNHLVAALARLFPSGIWRTNIAGWSDDWHGCCFINLPSGQISYHYHDSHAHLFAGLPAYETPWDGHDKDAVHDRLALLPSAASEDKGGGA